MNNKIKIAHLTSAHHDRDVRIFHKECVSLAAAGYDVYMILPNAEERIEKGVKVVSFKFNSSSRLTRAYKSVNRVYQKAIEVDADIYHLHDPELLRIALKLKKRGKKVIFDAHEDLPRQVLTKAYIPKMIRKPLSQFLERYENKVTAKIDGVVTATPFIRDRFLPVNSNTVDINNFPLMSEIELDEPDYHNREDAVCYIGAISRIRGIREMIQAVGIAKTKLYLAGKLSEEMIAEFSQMEGWKYVTYLNLISREESIAVKKKCIAGIVPFLWAENHVNAQPNKIFEYMASGLPVLCSNFDLWKIIVEDTQSGLTFDSSNPQSMAEAILNLKSKPANIAGLGLNGNRLVKERFNWSAEEQKLVAFYAKIVLK